MCEGVEVYEALVVLAGFSFTSQGYYQKCSSMAQKADGAVAEVQAVEIPMPSMSCGHLSPM